MEFKRILNRFTSYKPIQLRFQNKTWVLNYFKTKDISIRYKYTCAFDISNKVFENVYFWKVLHEMDGSSKWYIGKWFIRYVGKYDESPRVWTGRGGLDESCQRREYSKVIYSNRCWILKRRPKSDYPINFSEKYE